MATARGRVSRMAQEAADDTGGVSTTAREWEREWRRDVTATIRQLGEQQQQTAMILERVATRVSTLEAKPGEQRAIFSNASQFSSVLIAGAALLVALLSTILPHLSFR